MRSVESSNAIHTGARVMSADGKTLGMVKDVREDRFLVDVHWAPDYWLGTESVDSVSDELVQLYITKSAVGSAKLRSYDVAGPSSI